MRLNDNDTEKHRLNRDAFQEFPGYTRKAWDVTETGYKRVSSGHYLEVRNDLPAHDLLKFLGADLAGGIAKSAIVCHVDEIRLRHVDPVVLHERRK